MHLKPADTTKVQRKILAAWNCVQPGHAGPLHVQVLQSDAKAWVCRIEGAMPEALSIIAKGIPASRCALEREVYEAILPALPVRSPRYFGSWNDPDQDMAWLFIEDAGEVVWSRDLAEHQILAAQWLADLHSSSLQCAAAQQLPSRGPDHYLNRLRALRQVLIGRLAGLVREDETVKLDRLIEQLFVLESHWAQIEQFCLAMPSTFVHGDFAEDNIRLAAAGTGMTLLVFDWEKAGWGVPAVDLHAIDTVAYWTKVKPFWQDLGQDAIEQMRAYGAIFRTLSKGIGAKPIKTLLRHHKALARAVRAAGLPSVEVPGGFDP